MTKLTGLLSRNPADSVVLRLQASLSYIAQLFLLPILMWHFATAATGTVPNDSLAQTTWFVMLVLPILFLWLSWRRYYVRKHAAFALLLAVFSTAQGQGWIFTDANAVGWLAAIWVFSLAGLWHASMD